MFKEFKEFLMRGNVVDLAVGVIIGAAFGAVVTSMVSDIIMPPIGYLTKGINFADLFVVLNGASYKSLDAAIKDGAPVVAYGKFLNAFINFVIIAAVVFLIGKQVARFQKKSEPAPAPPPPATKDCPMCTTAIPAAAKRCPACTTTF